MKAISIPREKGELVVCESAGELGRKSAEFFAEAAGAAVQRTGSFSVALSGGSTPALMYRALLSQELRDRVPWAKGEYFWSDERCVPPDHPESNYGLAKRELLSKVPVRRECVHRMKGEEEPERAAADYEQELRRVFRDVALPRFDLMILGLGANGHTASLFPGSSALNETRRWTVASYVEELKAYRLTFTFPVINAARHVVFVISGKEKAPALRQVLRGGGAPVPAERVHPVEGKLIWFVEEAAAAELE
ncbi:MAG TPA: 6-phosphogluconolactonase [Terriglobales bacterium]|jgi:6-phosphogluconolactonase|nr:6-phosphogluconolactonase [Terriglobales bacterium]